MKNITQPMKSFIVLALFMLAFIQFSSGQRTMLITESFESGNGIIPPLGWAVQQVTGVIPGVNFITASSSPLISAAYDGTKFVQYGSNTITNGSTRLTKTGSVSTVNKTFVMVDFAWFEDPGYPANQDKVEVQWSTDGTTWITAETFDRFNNVAGWKFKNAVLPAGASNQSALFVGFLFTSAHGNNCSLDMVHVTAGPVAPPAFATIGTGIESIGWPYYTYFMGSRTQMLYTAAQLSAAGATPGTLSSVGFNITGFSSQPMINFNIKMGATTAPTLTEFVTGLNTVYASDYTVPGTGWRDLVLTMPFVWDGSSNVIVEICFGDNGSFDVNSTVMGTPATSTTWHFHEDDYAGCSGSSAGYFQEVTPNIRFGIPPITPGVLMGFVRDQNSLDPVAGAIIRVGNARDTSRANGMYVIYNVHPGDVAVNYTANGYIAGSSLASIVSGSVSNLDILLAPGPKIEGIVTDVSTNLPVVGATIIVGTGAEAISVLSVEGGVYLSPLLSISGQQPVTVAKTGFEDFTGSVSLSPGTTSALNASVVPAAVQPGPFSATLNPPLNPTAVNLGWGIPQAMYQTIYDDGIQDDFAIWSAAGNLNAMKFTPQGWPVKVTGGKVFLGKAENYPANARPLTKFKMLLYKADGAGGVPGTKIDSVIVIPADFGWADFSFASPVTISSGDFFLVMRQAGTPPHAAGIGIDLTNPHYRSYSKFVSNGSPWIPAAGNFMLRAIMQGAGTPSMNDNLPLALSYQVWRLKQGQENNENIWTSLGTVNVNSTTDNDWSSIPDSPYRWAVKAIYSPPGQRFSAPVFSNIIGKGWIANTKVCVTLSCAADSKAGTRVQLVNTDYPDTNYIKVTDTYGCVQFTGVWKGNYILTISRFTYPVYNQNIAINADGSYNISLIQEAIPATDLTVNDQSLRATWSPPKTTVYQLDETFSTGSFSTNQWEISGGTNWVITDNFGVPSPSAMFNYLPMVENYHQYLTSKSLAGVHAPKMVLKYDIYLDNYGTTSVNTMAVELWNGTTWIVLKTYTNQDGSLPWTSESLDISSQTHNPDFKIRFHAAGEDIFDINNWNVDNIKVISTDELTGTSPCVLGYNFYLNDVQLSFLSDTTYSIPPNKVIYGETNKACVKAVYAGGYSPEICVNFTSYFLYPARDLTATALECNTYLTWKKPVTLSEAPKVPAFHGVIEHSHSFTGRAPQSLTKAAVTRSKGQPSVSNAFGIINISQTDQRTVNFDVDNVDGYATVAPVPSTDDWWHDIEFPANQTDFAYAIKDGSDHLFKLERATGAFTDLGSMGSGTTNQFLDLAIDGSNGDIYGVSSDANTLSNDKLWKIDPTVPTATLIGPTVTSKGMVSLAGDKLGNIWGYDLVNDNFFSLNKETGLATVVGPIGFDANFGQSMFYDEAVNTITMAAFNNTDLSGQIRAVDVTTGASTILSSTPNQIAAASLPVTTGGGGTPPGVAGYNIYRDGVMVYYNPHRDSVSYYDYGLNPGIHIYDVKTKYDLTDYGFPGLYGESLSNTAGEQTINLICGRPLPFDETWDAGTFAFNNWIPAGHWIINTGIGNPASCADFTWLPAVSNYSQALTSDVINASPWTCAKIWLDLDIKLIDRNNTGKEKLMVELYYNGSWHQKLQVVNNGSTNWVSRHIDISVVKGKSFRIRLVANGVNSADILHWYVDNIHAYGICTPATDLSVAQSHFKTTLSWTAPDCNPTPGTIMNFVFDDGTAEGGVAGEGNVTWLGTEFPISNAFDGVLQQFKMYWKANIIGVPFTMQVDVYDADHVFRGSSATFQIPSDDWVTVTAPNIPFSGPFYAMVKWNNNPVQTNFLGWDNNGPYASQDLGWYRDVNGTWQKISPLLPTLGPGCFIIQAKALVGTDKKVITFVPGAKPEPGVKVNAEHLVTTNARIDTHFYGVMGVETEQADSSVFTGYNIYRTASTGIAPYAKLNSSPVSGTTYVDTYPSSLVTGTFKYYVTSLYKNNLNDETLCESSSDTVMVAFPHVGINELNNGRIMVYPNPATQMVNIRSDFTISAIDVMNFAGQTVYACNNFDVKTASLNVASFKPGIYFVKVTATEGIQTVKLTVIH